MLYVNIPSDLFFLFQETKKNKFTKKSGVLQKYKPAQMLQKSVHSAVKEYGV